MKDGLLDAGCLLLQAQVQSLLADDGQELEDQLGAFRFPSSAFPADEDTLVVMALPQAAIAFVGNGEDVRWKLAQVAPAVLLHGGALVQASDGLVGVH